MNWLQLKPLSQKLEKVRRKMLGNVVGRHKRSALYRLHTVELDDLFEERSEHLHGYLVVCNLVTLPPDSQNTVLAHPMSSGVAIEELRR